MGKEPNFEVSNCNIITTCKKKIKTFVIYTDTATKGVIGIYIILTEVGEDHGLARNQVKIRL